MFKKWMAFVLACMLVVGMVPTEAFAAEYSQTRIPEPVERRGTTADGFEYAVYDDHAEITGHTGYEKELVIPSQIEGLPVTVIGKEAFYFQYKLESVTIPKGVRIIGDSAFERCEVLKRVTIPEGLTTIGNHAFDYCRYLTDVTIPSSVTAIGESAFAYCLSLESVTIPKGVTTIGDYAFTYCISLKSVTISEGVVNIGNWAFNQCGLTSVTIPKSVSSIGDAAFAGCYFLTSVTIPSSVSSIGIAPFRGCASLTGIYVDKNNPHYSNDDHGVLFNKDKTELIQAYGAIQGAYSIPKRVTLIGDHAFASCDGLTGVTIPEGVASIGDSAFESCDSLSSVTIPEGVASIGDSAFDSCKSLKSVTIPGSVKTIGYDAFLACESMSSLTISEGVISIGDQAFHSCESLKSVTIPGSVTSIGEAALRCCDNLTGIHVKENNPNYSSDSQGVLYNKEKTELIQAPGAIEVCAIPDCTGTIGRRAFASCGRLTSVTIPKNVTRIESGAFEYCEKLSKITFGGSAPSVGGDAFQNVTATVYYPSGNSSWTGELMDSFYDSNLTWVAYAHKHDYEATITAPTCTEQGYTTYWCSICDDISVSDYVEAFGHDYVDGICAYCGEDVPSGAFTYTVHGDHVEITGYAGSDTQLLIPARIKGLPVTIIGDRAFDWSNSLTAVTIPRGITTIGASAFASCYNLTHVTIPTSVTHIGAAAFSSCESMTEIKLPGSVVSIGGEAFYNCKSLTGIRVDESNPAYSSDSRGVLFNKEKTRLIQAPGGISGAYGIPDSVTGIGVKAFYNCDGLTGVTIPERAVWIGESAFSSCDGLTGITIPKDIVSIGRWAFNGCANLEGFHVDEGNRYFSSDGDGVLFNREKTELIQAPLLIDGFYSIPEGVTDIRGLAFSGCTGLTDIAIPESVASIQSLAFSGCTGLTNLTIPAGVTSIDSNAFEKCSGLTKVVISEGVTSIGSYMFDNCTGLTDVTIPETVTVISPYAFQKCTSLTNVTIPKGVDTIAEGAFKVCLGLTGITFCGDAPYISQNVFSGVTAMARYPSGNATWTAEVMKNYGGNLTWNADEHTHEYEAVITAPTCTGQGCTTHTCVCGDSFVTDYVDALGHDYAGNSCIRCGLEVAADGITYEVLGDHVEITGYTGAQRDLVIPAQIEGLPVTCIRDLAFYYCDSLTGVTIPESVTRIGNHAFLCCTMLTGFSVDPDNPNYSSDSRGVLFDKEKTVLIQAPGAIEGIYSIPDSVARICDMAFYFNVLLTGVEIPEGVTDIGASAFALCWYLNSVTIPESVMHIGTHAFGGCSYLTGIWVHEENPQYSSDSCGVLFDKEKRELIQAPCRIKGAYVIPDSAVIIGDDAFADCSDLTGVTIPEGVTYIGKHAFDSCEHMTSVTIPGSVAYIGAWAFGYCSDLTEITFCGDVPVVGEGIFYDVTANAYYPAGNTTWTPYVMVGSGGNLTWAPHGHGHEYEAVITYPTCTEGGYTTYTCECGDSFVGDDVDALGHSFGSWVRIRKPTAAEDGLEERSCRRCGYTEQRTIDKLETPFDDVEPGTFYYESVKWAVRNGITNGTSPTTFGPNDQCMRAHVVTFLWRAVGCPEPERNNNPFVDVKATDFYYKPVLWALENGITSGMDATHFGPTSYCNRAQVVTFLYRTMESPGVESVNNPFTDVPAGQWFTAPVLWAVENGITNGLSATTFGPDAICNRAQIVTFLYRAFHT